MASPSFFYQKFWDIIKKDVIAMFDEFYKGKLHIYILNFALVTLILEVTDASI